MSPDGRDELQALALALLVSLVGATLVMWAMCAAP